MSPLGAAAGGGSRLPLDPAVPARDLGLDRVFDNSLDAVGSRDASTEYMFCAARTLLDLSRLAEEIVLWASAEFGWMVPADRQATGSSLLPHKRNPDVAELVRAKAASAIGHLTAALAIEKGLPHSYGRDLQQAQEHLFALHDDLVGSLAALAGLVGRGPLPAAAAPGRGDRPGPGRGPGATGHRLPGRARGGGAPGGRPRGRGRGTSASLTAADLAAAHPRFEPADVALVDPVASVQGPVVTRRRVVRLGGTATGTPRGDPGEPGEGGLTRPASV